MKIADLAIKVKKEGQRISKKDQDIFLKILLII